MRIRLFGRNDYAWAECFENIDAPTVEAAQHIGIMHAMARFPWATSVESETMPGDCPRTLALWKPGVPQPNVNHAFAWSGRMPCTGRLRCTLCGEDSES